MSTPPNMPLRASQRKELQQKKLRRQGLQRVGVLLLIILVALVSELFFVESSNNDLVSPLLITKSVAMGAGLNWLAQSVFSWFVFRYNGAKSKHNIVGHMYLGQIIKWLIVIGGFSVIFLMVTPESPLALIVGFIVMQISHFFILTTSR